MENQFYILGTVKETDAPEYVDAEYTEIGCRLHVNMGNRTRVYGHARSSGTCSQYCGDEICT